MPIAAGRRAAVAAGAAGKKRELFMWEALREGIDEEMEKDPTVCVMGQFKAWEGAELVGL
jgi:pyruvate dehydrogenase E1 component beta subunit